MDGKVQVLLSTYNGERYIKQQIDSILSQQGVDVSLLIRDDGSKDKTCAIIEEYDDSRITIVKGTNIGATNSFLELINLAGDFDFYSFADQDDIWDADKLLVAIESISKIINKPVIYSSNTRLVNEKLELIESKERNPKISLGSALMVNYVAGCTAVFNRELMNLLKQHKPKDVPYHDWWVNLVALSVGGVSFFDTMPHMSYRQHSNNVVGASTNVISKWKSRWHKFIRQNYHREKMAKQLLEFYGQAISDEDERTLMNLAEYKTKKIEIVTDRNMRTSSKIDNLMFWICIFTHRI